MGGCFDAIKLDLFCNDNSKHYVFLSLGPVILFLRLSSLKRLIITKSNVRFLWIFGTFKKYVDFVGFKFLTKRTNFHNTHHLCPTHQNHESIQHNVHVNLLVYGPIYDVAIV